jgi:hypothetical protein
VTASRCIGACRALGRSGSGGILLHFQFDSSRLRPMERCADRRQKTLFCDVQHIFEVRSVLVLHHG